MTVADFRPAHTTASVTTQSGEHPGWPFAEMLSDERPELVLRVVAAESMSALRERNLRRALADLERIATRLRGWDGSDGLPLAADALVTAARLVVRLSRDDELLPHLVPLSTGGVQLEWHVAGRSLEIEVDRRGRPHFLAVTAGGDVMLDEEPAPGRIELGLGKARHFLDDLASLLRGAR